VELIESYRSGTYEVTTDDGQQDSSAISTPTAARNEIGPDYSQSYAAMPYKELRKLIPGLGQTGKAALDLQEILRKT